MKKYLFTILLTMLVVGVFAQIKDPVQWTYTASKKSATTYEIVISAKVPKPWHIYSQTTPDGGPVPTSISFKKNPLVQLTGKINEVGSLKVEDDKVFGVQVKYYTDKVDFVQTINVKANAKTTVGGTVEYMVCDDKQCLPPTKKTFNIKL